MASDSASIDIDQSIDRESDDVKTFMYRLKFLLVFQVFLLKG